MNFTLTAIDVAIGLIFVYLLLSSICSVVQEFIANVTSWRGKHLRNSIQSMLNDQAMTGLAKRLYSHPRIATLTFAGKLPSYIPSATFAAALVDIVAEDGNLNSIDGPLAPFVRDAGGEVDKLKAEFGNWFDDSMAGFGGWYKRNVQIVIFVIALVLTAILNVNSFDIANALWTQPLLRDAVVQSAGNFYQQDNANNQRSDNGNLPGKQGPQESPDAQGKPSPPGNGNSQPPLDERFKNLKAKVDELALPIGWDGSRLSCLFGQLNSAPPPATGSSDKSVAPGCGSVDARAALVAQPDRRTAALRWEWLVLIAGWITTALAASLGSQFWFQTLGEALRAAGAKPSKSSDDDQDPSKGSEG